MKANNIKRISFLLILGILFFADFSFAGGKVEDFLVELGKKYYARNNYADAQHEFNKALILNPDNQEAIKFLGLIKEKAAASEAIIAETTPQIEYQPEEIARSPQRQEAIDEALKNVTPKEIKPEEEIEAPLLPPVMPEQNDLEAQPEEKISIQKPLPEELPQEEITEATVEEKPEPLSPEPLVQEPSQETAIQNLPPEKKQEEESAKEYNLGNVKFSGTTRMSAGLTSKDFYWKRANADLNEREWRLINENALNRRDNTYDPGIYDRMRLNVDTKNPSGINLHSNITVDPWSFTGKSDKINIKSGTDSAEIQLLYWSNTGYTINQTISTLGNGVYLNLPEIKVDNGRILQTTVKTDSNNLNETFTIPETKIKREFWPLREFWLDYKENDAFKFRFFPMAYQDQALTSDDPLQLSNHHTWWEESPWLDSWKKGNLDTALTTQTFTKGQWDDTLSFLTRDSDGTRLTALRGFSFDWKPVEETSLSATVASPKTLWQDYDRFDALPGAVRLKQSITDNFNLGGIYTFRLGFDKSKSDATNQLGGIDFAFAPVGGLKLSAEAAQSFSEQDKSSSFRTKKRGSAFYFSLLSDISGRDILDLNYDEIKPKKGQDSFLKLRFFAGRMDKGFDPGLSTYRETRNDTFWGRHIHFRPIPEYYSSGIFSSGTTLDDIMPFKIGNSLDTGRNVLGLRLETSLLEGRLEGLGDIRNAHFTNGKYLETVSRTEWSYKPTPRLTTKLLALNHDLPHTKGGFDPFIYDPDLDIPLINSAIPDGKDPSLNTASFGLDYKLFDWLSWDGVYEHTNDFTVAENNFPRRVLNDKGFINDTEYGMLFRRRNPFLYDQTAFPLPPYEYEDIFRSGISLTPADKWDIYLNYTHNGFKFAGPIDNNMNQIGAQLYFMPNDKFGVAFEYTYARFWDDLVSRQIAGHHNFFTQFRRKFSVFDELIFEYGVGSHSSYGTGVIDPLGGGEMVLDTRHIFKISYNRKF